MTALRFAVRPFDVAAARRLEAGGIPAPLARVLAARGIARAEDLLLAPQNLIAPQQLTHVASAARLLADAIERRERLLIVKRGNNTTHTVTIQPVSGTIDGAASVTLTTAWQRRMFMSDGTEYFEVT
jgi:hypothetical protein